MPQYKCAQPWYELNIYFNGQTAPCCYYTGPFSILNAKRPVDLKKVWNSRQLQIARSIFVKGNTEGTGCANCHIYFRHQEGNELGYFPQFEEMAPDLTTEQRTNWERAVTNFRNKKVVLDSFPLRYFINFGIACNLDCIMCSQTYLRPNSETLPATLFRGWLPYFRMAQTIDIVGGEPFVLREAREFMSFVADEPTLGNVKLGIVTNGLLLKKNLDLLKNKHRLSVGVSLDAIGPYYEKIRRGSKWEAVEDSVLSFRDFGRSHGLDWTVCTQNLIMKTSIKSLVKLVDWHIDNDIAPSFYDFIVTDATKDAFAEENVFAKPGLLRSLDGWEESFLTAAEKLEGRGWSSQAHVLRNMRKELQGKAEEMDRRSTRYRSHDCEAVEEELVSCRFLVETYKAEMEALLRSRSWKITAPLRWLNRHIRRLALEMRILWLKLPLR